VTNVLNSLVSARDSARSASLAGIRLSNVLFDRHSGARNIVAVTPGDIYSFQEKKSLFQQVLISILLTGNMTYHLSSLTGMAVNCSSSMLALGADMERGKDDLGGANRTGFLHDRLRLVAISMFRDDRSED
jgi:hypothetical protein